MMIMTVIISGLFLNMPTTRLPFVFTERACAPLRARSARE